MAQFSRPSSTLASATWGFVGVSFHGSIDDVASDDADFIYATAGGSVTAAEVALSTVTDPASSSDHIVHFRYSTTTVPPYAAPNDLTVSLYEGATLIAEDTVEPTGTITSGSFTLSGPEADAITDYSALSLQFAYNYGGFGDEIRIYQAYLEVPDAGAGTGGFTITLDEPMFRVRVGTLDHVVSAGSPNVEGKFGTVPGSPFSDSDVLWYAFPDSEADMDARQICSKSGMLFPGRMVVYRNGRPYGQPFAPDVDNDVVEAELWRFEEDADL